MRKVLLMLLVVGIGLTFAAQYTPLSKAEAIKGNEFNIQIAQHKPVINKLSSSRSVIFSENFTNTAFPPVGWTIISTATAESTWHRSTLIYHSEPASAAVWWSWQHQDEWLISPAITLTGAPGNAYYLKWWYYGYRGSTYGDHYYTKIIVGDDTTVLYDLSTQVGQWNYFDLPVEIDLSSYAGQTVKIAFHAFDGYPLNIGLWYAWGIDDVEIGYLDILHDVGVTNISCDFPIIVGTPEPITITVKNFGAQTQTSIPVYLSDGTTTLSATLTCNLPSLAETIYTFSWQPTSTGDFDLYAWTALPLDEDHSNDTAMISVVVCPPYHVPPYSKDFDEDWGPYGDNPPFCGWTIVDNGDEDPPVWNENDWGHFTFEYGDEERSLAGIVWYPVENQDDWLISPRFNCALPGQYTLGYWHFYRGYPADFDTGYVLVSTNGGTTWTEITKYVGHTNAIIDSGYKTHDITALVAGQSNVKIAFRYFASDAYYWVVDDFTLDFIPANTSLTININPAGAGSVLKQPDLPQYPAGTWVKLTAQANPGYQFSSWSGDLTSTNNPDSIYMNGNKTVIANFTATGPGGWAQLKPLPTGVSGQYVKAGGALTATNDFVFAFRGNKSNEFYKYIPTSDSWVSVKPIPFYYKPNSTTINNKTVGKGAALCWDGGNYIYAIKGNGTYEFWKYDINNDSWIFRAWTPNPIKAGSGLTYLNGYVYLMTGGKKPGEYPWLFRFCEPGDTWGIVDYYPENGNKPIKAGYVITAYDSVLYFMFFVKTTYGDRNFIRKTNPHRTEWHYYYPESLPTFDTILKPDGSRTLKKYVFKDGAAAVTAGSAIYVIKGGGANTFYRYWPTGTSSEPGVVEQLVRDTIPRLHKKSVPKTGASLAYANGYVYLLKGNNTPEFWRYTPHSALAEVEVLPTTNTAVMTQNSITNLSFNFTVNPNPFNKFTTIRYTVPVAGKVSIKLYNASGRLIKTLVNEHLNAGSYSTTLTNIASGVYFLKYESDNNCAEVKLTVR